MRVTRSVSRSCPMIIGCSLPWMSLLPYGKLAWQIGVVAREPTPSLYLRHERFALHQDARPRQRLRGGRCARPPRPAAAWTADPGPIPGGDRKSVVAGKGGSVPVDPGGRPTLKKKN